MIIGIDIGGTKSEAALFDEAGNTQQKIILKSAHPNCATDAEMEEILRQCLLDDCSPWKKQANASKNRTRSTTCFSKSKICFNE